MGLFWNGLYDGHRWTESDEEPAEVPDGCLAVSVHDSDIGVVRYAPVGDGSGTAFVGFTPRTYFEDETAPTCDPDVEAAALVAWAETTGMAAPAVADVRPFLAGDDDTFDEEDDPFVESAVAGLLTMLGVPVPEALGGWGVDGLDSTERTWDR